MLISSYDFLIMYGKLISIGIDNEFNVIYVVEGNVHTTLMISYELERKLFS